VSKFKFAKKQKVKATRWADVGASKKLGFEAIGVVIARTSARDSLEGRNYYTVQFDGYGCYEVAEDELQYDNVLDRLVDETQ
jgi:hypothetical protein